MLSRPRPWIILALVTLGFLLPGNLKAADSKAASPMERPAPRLDELPFSELPEAFVEETPRNESAENRLLLTTLLTKARLQEHRGNVAGALETYQRANRLSPGSSAILQEIVRLGFLLERNEIASRYAIDLAEHQTKMSADALQRVARYCLEDNQTERAIQLYERALALLLKEKANAQALGIQFRLMSIYRAHGEPKMAARHAQQIARMLADPNQFGINEVIDQFKGTRMRATYEELGSVYLEAEQPDNAAKMFDLAEKTESNPAMNLVRQAEVAVAKKDWDRAQKELDQYFQGKEHVADALPYQLLQQVIEASAPTPEDALVQLIERLKKLHDQSPDAAALAYFLSDLYAQQDDWDKVIQMAAPLIADHPDPKAQTMLCQAYIANSQWPPLVLLLANSLGKSYDLDSIAEPLQQMIDDPAKWSALDKHLQGLDPAKLPLNERIGLSRLYLLANQGETAWRWAEAALADMETPEKAQLLMQFGLQAFRNDQEVIAEKAFRTAVKLGLPKSQTSLFYFYLATTLEMQGKTSDALRTAKRAALLDEESALLRSRIPWTLYHAGRTDEAVDEYEKLLDKFAGDYENRQTRQVIRDAKRLLSSIASQKKQIPEATEWLEQVLDEFPSDTGAMNDLGYLWIDNQMNLGRGYTMIRQAVAAEPDNYAFQDSMGWASYRLGRLDEAIAQLKHAAEIAAGKDGTVLDHLGDVYLAAGKKDKAIAAWNEAAKALQQDAKDAAILKAVEAKIKQHS